MLKVETQDNKLIFGNGFQIVLERTLRIPDDGNNYPLPPGLGSFPVHRVADFKDTVPAHWLKEGGYFIPMYQREAMWIRLNGRQWRPNAIKVGIGRINAVSGTNWNRGLRDTENDYVVAPPQPWLDGINVGDGVIRQFVAMPLGEGYTVEGQLTGKEDVGGLQLIVYEPKPGLYPTERPEEQLGIDNAMGMMGGVMNFAAAPAGSTVTADMGLGAGGTMKQKIYEDPHGIDTWDEDNTAHVFIHIVNSDAYKAITGLEPPESPVSAEAYTKYGFPWFDIYDEHMTDISAPDDLKSVQSIKDMDAEKGVAEDAAEVALDIGDEQIVKYETLDNLPERDDIELWQDNDTFE